MRLMRLAYTDDQEAMRTELREYYADLLDPETQRPSMRTARVR